MKRIVFICLVSGLLAGCRGAVTPVPTEPQPPAATSAVGAAPLLSPDEPPPAGATQEFKTDFSRHSVPYADIRSGGPPKDGIPAIDAPQYVSVSAADAWLRPAEPVILVQVGDDVRAFPIQILIWHEIANAEVGGLPLVVTFCPLCNTAIAFERRVDGQTLDFGTTGRLRFSNLIMYDRQTETWWQQATGEAVAGQFTGEQLTYYPASLISWATFKTAYPNGLVLSRETGILRDYGRNPYVGYDDINRPPFLYDGPVSPDTLPAVARVITVDRPGDAVAYPYDTLQQVGVVNDAVGGLELAVFWAPGTASALDAVSVAGGREVGSVGVFERELDGQLLTFTLSEGQIVDSETGSTWNGLGQAIAGPLVGRTLTPVVAINHFWFSWAAFRPDTRVYRP